MKEYLPEGRRWRTAENRALLQTPEGVQKAFQQHIPLEARVVRCDQSHNLWVNLGGWQGVIPREEAALGVAEGFTRDIALLTRVGQPAGFYVEGLEGHGGTIQPRLSRRALQQEALDALFRTRRPGDILPVTVTHLEPFGAFVDIGCGLPSMIGLKQISVSRIPHPSARFQVGQELYAMITALSPETGRIFLSHRELLGTWEENAALFRVGETVPGVVRGVHSYGSFIELTPNLSGLTEQVQGLSEGDWVSVCIRSIDPRRMKLKLAVIRKLPEPSEPVPLRYWHREGNLPMWCYAPTDSPKPGTAAWEAPAPPIARP